MEDDLWPDRPNFFDPRKHMMNFDWEEHERAAKKMDLKSNVTDIRDTRDPIEFGNQIANFRAGFPDKTITEILDMMEGLRSL